jgi:hypothetical protein
MTAIPTYARLRLDRFGTFGAGAALFIEINDAENHAKADKENKVERADSCEKGVAYVLRKEPYAKPKERGCKNLNASGPCQFLA